MFVLGLCITTSSSQLLAWQTVAKEANGTDQKEECIGKPKPSDTVAAHHNARSIKKNGKKERQDFISTVHIGPLVNLKCTDVNSTNHKGLCVGLNKVVQTMELGEEATVIIPSAKAFGEKGLSMFYDASTGCVKNHMEIFGVAMANDPKSPADHHGHNPLCIACHPVDPGADICLELKLMKINEHNRAIKQGCWDCIWSSIAGGGAVHNSGTH